MSWLDDFLTDLEPRTWQAEASAGIRPEIYFLGNGDHALEVAVATSATRPRHEDVRKVWHARQGRRPSPLLLLVAYEGGAGGAFCVCGPTGEVPSVMADADVSQVERIVAAALAEPTRHMATRSLTSSLPELKTDLPGVRNSGLLATHELKNGVPSRRDWNESCAQSRQLLELRGRSLVDGLGFQLEPLSMNATILKVPGNVKRAVAIFLDETETFDEASNRFATSPVSHALALADQEGLPWVVLTRSRQIRLYPVRPDIGVGSKGRAETYIELDLTVLPSDQAGYLKLLFSSTALASEGTFEEVLSSSEDFAADLASRLRERVYFETVPRLAKALVQRTPSGTELSDQHLNSVYEQALTVLFRLLFLAYAEDKDLLPYRTNSRYADHALKTIARRLAEDRSSDSTNFDEHATSLWNDIEELWRTVESGNTAWGVPPYNGGLFTSDSAINPAGAALAQVKLTDAELGPALSALLVDESAEGVNGPVDFRSLSVREFGTLYEGLLESRLAIAPTDLTVDSKGNYVPASDSAPPVVHEGEAYFHNRSGERKSTGSYFTKPFAVEHLLDNALEPALSEHIDRLKSVLELQGETQTASIFFDFRCVDLAMGSGHFLVAAIDRIEARLSAFLALHPIAAVQADLERLHNAATTATGNDLHAPEIETTSLIRRQVARRCVYGLDLNPIAVELARLGLWIHTFVPGLPLSFLDHNLICGSSLTGIGSLDEAVEIIDPSAQHEAQASLFRQQITDMLANAEDGLRRLALVNDSTIADVKIAREAHAEALEAIEPARQLFDLLVAARLGRVGVPLGLTAAELSDARGLSSARDTVENLRAIHLPIAFPEVILRDRPGFDCILGNPPWEKLQLEEHSFYALSYPGLRSLSQARANDELARIKKTRPDLVAEYERETLRTQELKEALAAGPYPGLTAGRPDLYKAFAWRYFQLIRADGFVGVVLPRKALEASGMKAWRLEALRHASFADVTVLVNSKHWVFDDVDPRYTIALLSLRAATSDSRTVQVRGPYNSLSSYVQGRPKAPVVFSADDLLSWSDAAYFPILETERHLQVFSKIRSHPRLSTPRPGWEPRGMRELNASDDREHFVFSSERQRSLWDVYAGESFDLWEPETGLIYAQADPTHIIQVLQARRLNQIRIRRSALYGRSPAWAVDSSTLPAQSPRIAWRDSARATDSRTVRVALIPPQKILVHQAYTLFWRDGSPAAESYALGILSSIPFDWFARQVVESHVTVEFMNSAPIPAFDSENPLCQRLVRISATLAAVDSRYTAWADSVGVDIGGVKDAEKMSLLAELDALSARLYGLDSTDVQHIFETMHRGWDFSDRLGRVLQHLSED